MGLRSLHANVSQLRILVQVGKCGAEIDRNTFPNKKLLARIEKELTVTPNRYNPRGVKIESFPVFKQVGSKLYLPPHFLREHYSRHIELDRRGMRKGKPANINFVGVPRENQRIAIKKVRDGLDKYGGGILTIPCGGGKTVLAINEICHRKLKTLVVVHKDFLGKQWYNRFQKFSNARVGFLGGKKPVLTEADVARVARSKRSRGGSKRDKWEVLADDNDVVVATVQTLCKGTKVPQSFYDKFGMVVIDECHHMAARSFSRALSEIYTGYMLGLSATPKRKDGLADVFHWWMGPTLHYEPPKPNPRVRVNRYRFRCAHEDFKEQKSWMGGGRTGPDQVKTISKLIDLRERNSFIVDRIWDRLLTPGARILVLSDRLAHLESMRKELRRRDDAVRAALRRTGDAMERISSGSGEHLYAAAERRLKLTKMVGGMKADVMKAAEEGTVIFSTFALAEEGLDVEALNTVVLTTTKTTILQSVGRILRAMDYADGLEPLVIDMVDQIPLISRQALKRMEEYQICKYNITDYDERCNVISARSQDVKKFISNNDIMAIETDDDEEGGDNAELCYAE